MDKSLRGELQADLDALAGQGLRRTVEPQVGHSLATDFTSNDYLGLAFHPAILEASASALAEYGAGARASRLLGGGSPLEREAEQAMASWVGSDAALLFPTGFQANLGLITSLARPGDVLLCDERMHASMIDACRLTRARRRIFAHGDLEHLDQLLADSQGAGRRLVLVESIFSMNGDAAPLPGIIELCERHDAWAIVDEAHAIGVRGPHGAGLVAELESIQRERVLACVMTGGKALGCSGGFVAGSRELRELLIHRARSFVFTTGIAPALAAGLATSIRCAAAADQERAQLRRLSEQLAAMLDLPLPAGAILPFAVGDNQRALELSNKLRGAGYEVRAVRPPTVPAGAACLRVVLHSYNTSQAVIKLGNALCSEPRPPVSQVTVIKQPLPLVVVGTDTGIGKTVVSGLLSLALAKDQTVTYWKPVQTGDDSDTRTVQGLTSQAQVAFAKPAYEFPLPASPHTAAAAANSEIDFEALVRKFDEERGRAAPGVVVAELAGGLLVPYDDLHSQADWLTRVRPRVVLVARSGLGTLNHTLLTLEALRARRLQVETLFLVGEAHSANRKTLEQWSGIRRIVEVPIFEQLDENALAQWLDEHQEILS